MSVYNAKKFVLDRSLIMLYGSVTAVALIAYYFIMKAFGFEDFPQLRYFNILIFFVGSFLGVRQFFRRHASEHPSYFSGFFQTAAITIFANIIFVIFMTILLMVITPEAGLNLLDKVPLRMEIGNVGILMVALFIEGTMLGFANGLICMQLFK